jgi:stalled ribosome rescue protein Dom34
MDIQPPRQITIRKPVFDSMHVRKLDQMIREQEQGNLIAITMEEGIAHIFLVS